MTELARIQWRCRRGLLELDLLLQRFAERDYATLNHNDRLLFEELLAYPDMILWDAIRCQEPPTDPRMADIFKRLRES